MQPPPSPPSGRRGGGGASTAGAADDDPAAPAVDGDREEASSLSTSSPPPPGGVGAAAGGGEDEEAQQRLLDLYGYEYDDDDDDENAEGSGGGAARSESRSSSNYYDCKQNPSSFSSTSEKRKKAAVIAGASASEEPSPSSSFPRRLSRRASSVVVENLPDTPAGWAALTCAAASAALGYEVSLQRHLTSPPAVYGQVVVGGAKGGNGANRRSERLPLGDVYERLAKKKSSSDGILSRPIRPSLFVGTRAASSSAFAYLSGGPKSSNSESGSKSGSQRSTTKTTTTFLRFREDMTMTQDGATVAVDWELPPPSSSSSSSRIGVIDDETRMRSVLRGPIDNHVVLIFHGINNDSSFGYVRSLARACTHSKGWVAACFNFRGCGGSKLTTPRGYNGAYTGDIRCCVWKIAARLAPGRRIFLVGNSLGASLVTKYLGEEGLSGTLPPQVAGAVALGNPLSMNMRNVSKLLSPVMALGVKKFIAENWKTMRYMNNKEYRSAIRRAMLAPMLAGSDEALAPVFARNETTHPFAFRVGYENGEHYWREGSSFRYVGNISVPTMQILAGDDFLIFHPFRGKLRYCLNNPNVMVVETRCGGHLGWQESPPDSKGWWSAGLGTSWADVATTDFIEAVLETQKPQLDEEIRRHRGGTGDQDLPSPAGRSTAAAKDRQRGAAPIRSRL